MNTRRILRTALLALAALLAAAAAQAQVGDDYGNTPADAFVVDVTTGTALVPGVLETDADIDMFAITLTAPAIVSLQTTPDAAGAAVIETFVLGRGSQGSTATALAGAPSLLEQVLPAGAHYVAVSGFAGTFGSYSLSVEVSTDPATRSVALTPGAPTPLATAFAQEHELLAFGITLTVPGLLRLDGQNATIPDLVDSRALLTDVALAPIGQNDDGQNAPHFGMGGFLPAGDYWLFVDEVSARTGSFLVQNTFTETGAALPVPGSVSATGAAVYTLTLGAPQDVTLMSLGGADVRAALYSGATEVASDDDSGPGMNFSIGQALAAGVYQLVVETVDGANSPYQVVASTAGSQIVLYVNSGNRLVFEAGELILGSLQVAIGGTHWFTFQSPIDLAVTIIDSNGQEVFSATTQGSASFPVDLTPGGYQVLVSSPSGSPGVVSLQIAGQRQAPANSLPVSVMTLQLLD